MTSVFEVIAGDETEKRVTSRKALGLAQQRVHVRLGKFLSSACSMDEFNARFSMVEDDFSGIVAVACTEQGHDKPEHIAVALRDVYASPLKPTQTKQASVHESRRPQMCPYHSEVTDISLASGDPAAGFNAMAQHAWGGQHCQGAEYGGSKCNFKREMTTQTYWDKKAEEADNRAIERAEQRALEPVVTPIPSLEETSTEPEMGIDSPAMESPAEPALEAAEPMAMAARWVPREVTHFLAHEVNFSDPNYNPDHYHICQNCQGDMLDPDGNTPCPNCGLSARHLEGVDNLSQQLGEGLLNPQPRRTADYDPSKQEGNDDDKVSCPECGGSGKTNGNKTCPKCKGDGKVGNFGASVLDALSKTAEKGNTDLGGPEPKIDKRKWTPQTVKEVDVPSKYHPTERKDPLDPIRAENDDELKEIGEKSTERVDLPTAKDDEAGFASNNMDSGPHTKTWGNDGQTDPVTKKKQAAGEFMEVQHPDSLEPYKYQMAPPEATQAIQHRFGEPHSVVMHPDKPNTYIYHPENFWDGPTHVTDLGNGQYGFHGYDGYQEFGPPQPESEEYGGQFDQYAHVSQFVSEDTLRKALKRHRS